MDERFVSISRSTPGTAGGGLTARPDALGADDALHHHGEPRVAQVKRAAGEQMGSADRGEVDADRAHREAGIGAAHHVHRDGVGIGGERLAAEAVAPGLVLAPGGSVGAAGTVAAGAGSVDSGAARQLLQLGAAPSGTVSGPNKLALQDQGAGLAWRASSAATGAGGSSARSAGQGRGPALDTPPSERDVSQALLRSDRERQPSLGSPNRLSRIRVPDHPSIVSPFKAVRATGFTKMDPKRQQKYPKSRSEFATDGNGAHGESERRCSRSRTPLGRRRFAESR